MKLQQQQTFALAAENIRKDLLLYLVIACYSIAIIAYLTIAGRFGQFAHPSYVLPWTSGILLCFPALAASLMAIIIIHRTGAKRRAFELVFTRQRMARFLAGMVLLAVMMLFLGSFTSFKTSMPQHGGFAHDRLFADIDAWLHFGRAPWEWTHALFCPFWLKAIEFNYNFIWFNYCFFMLFWMAVSRKMGPWRMQYMLTFMACWAITGNVLADIAISAGPAFYGGVTGDKARFAELLVLLKPDGNYSFSVHNFQQYLWHMYQNDITGFGAGISAFPSVHVSLAALNALMLSRFGLVPAIAAWTYLGIIVASSVHLGWHYAIDGYAGILLTALYFRLFERVPVMVPTPTGYGLRPLPV